MSAKGKYCTIIVNQSMYHTRSLHRRLCGALPLHYVDLISTAYELIIDCSTADEYRLICYTYKSFGTILIGWQVVNKMSLVLFRSTIENA